MPQLPAEIQWTTGRKIGLRFFIVFFLLYIFANPNGVIPFTESISTWCIQPLQHIIPWFAAHVLHLSKPITIFTNGSGDTTYDYVTLLFVTITAVLGCIAWTLLDRRRTTYDSLQYWLLVVIRYYLAATMLEYGIIKVIKLQFPYPDLNRLLEPYGHSSPMGLAWTYMGYSQGYNYFAGLAEATAGLLLLFRRTTAAGALLAFVVASHIMAMNYCFDIPVKLLSTMMVAMALYILYASGNIRRFTAFLFGNKTVGLDTIQPPAIRKRSLFITLRVIKFMLAAYIFLGILYNAIQGRSEYGEGAPKIPLRGIYSTRIFLRNKDTLAALQTDTYRWKRLVVDGSQLYPYATILKMDESPAAYYSVNSDTVRHTLAIRSYSDTTESYNLSYRFPTPDSLVLTGILKKDSLFITAKKMGEKDFLLMNRGFHFISEYPFNR